MKPATDHDSYYRPRAVVFIRTADSIEALERCTSYVRQHRYHLVGIITDDWEAVQRLIENGEAGVVVVDCREDLPYDREPRFEFVAEQPRAGRNQRQVHRRRTARVIRRAAGE